LTNPDPPEACSIHFCRRTIALGFGTGAQSRRRTGPGGGQRLGLLASGARPAVEGNSRHHAIANQEIECRELAWHWRTAGWWASRGAPEAEDVPLLLVITITCD